MAVTRRGPRRARVQRKNYRIDMAKLEQTQRILGTRTETDTIHRALDLVAEEAALLLALRDFVLKGGGHIESGSAVLESPLPHRGTTPAMPSRRSPAASQKSEQRFVGSGTTR